MKQGIEKVKVVNQSPIGAVLFVAYFGAAVYFWMQATGFWGHIWALIKAIVWPAILVYQAMQHLGV